MPSNYFDYAAATPIDPKVQEVMQPYFTEKFYNPSAVYLRAQEVRQDIEQSRGQVAEILGCKSSEIIFTSGGTESDNLAVQGVMNQFTSANCIISAVEHDAVLMPAKRYEHKIAPVKPDGRIDINALKKLIDDKTVLVSVMYANNEIGTIQPIAKVSQLIKEVRQQRVQANNQLPLYLHTDACQAANYLQLLVNTLGVDLMTLNGGKIYGPKQSGILYVRTGTLLAPQIVGGGQERDLRSGTENVPAIIGFAYALKEAQARRESDSTRLLEIKTKFIEELNRLVKSAVLNGNQTYRMPNNVHLTFPGSDNETLMMKLDEAGFQVAVGSACSASSDEPSHVLKAIGLSDEEARSSLRITFGRHTTQESAVALARKIAETV